MKALEQNILKVLAYFDVFNYPVLLTEIHYFICEEYTEEEVLKAVQTLEEHKIIFRTEGFISLKNDPALIARRKEGNKKAAMLLPKARRLARLLYVFPFVRGVCISGSLSKNFAYENSDFDYFIITKANRLWIARSLLGCLKKASFLIKRPHWFCLNYYIDENYLRIPEHNIFTATELLTLIAAAGNGTLNEFFKINNWASNYYPAYSKSRYALEPAKAEPFFKRFLESILNNTIGNNLDTWLMNTFTKRWERLKREGRLRNLQGEEIERCLTGKNYCKPNPVYRQAKVLNAFKERWNLSCSRFDAATATVASENK